MSKYQETNKSLESDNTSNDNIHLKIGQFYSFFDDMENKNKVLVSPLSQDDLARGWSLVLPRAHKKSRIHHFNIYLSQLPEHLWYQLQSDNDERKNYNLISDNIYKYSVQKSEDDNTITQLYNKILQRNLDINNIRELYKALEQKRVKGWLMIRTHHLLQINNCL